MEPRLLITDGVRSRIGPIPKEVGNPAGGPPALCGRMFPEAVLRQARAGIPWRDLPTAFGSWNAVRQRFRRRERSGVREGLRRRARERGDAAGCDPLRERLDAAGGGHGQGARQRRDPRDAGGAGRGGRDPMPEPPPRADSP